MKRTLNWTGRKSIPADLISIRLIEPAAPDQPQRFGADLNRLRELNLKPEARIYVEPYANSSSMRFPCGTLAGIAVPADTSLTEIDAGARVLFRVKIVDESGEVGKILASADAIRAQDDLDDEGRKALLPVVYRDIGQAIWQVDLQPGAQPLLVLSNQIPELPDRISGDPLFQGAVIPHAVRQVLEFVFLQEDTPEDGWASDWRKFAAGLNGGEEIDDSQDPEALKEQIRELVERYMQSVAWVRQCREKAAAAGGGSYA